MIKSKKVSATEGTPKPSKKENLINALKRAEKRFAKLRADIENDDDPDVTMLIVTCNKKTGTVTETIVGNEMGLMTTLFAVLERNEPLQRVFKDALILLM